MPNLRDQGSLPTFLHVGWLQLRGDTPNPAPTTTNPTTMHTMYGRFGLQFQREVPRRDLRMRCSVDRWVLPDAEFRASCAWRWAAYSRAGWSQYKQLGWQRTTRRKNRDLAHVGGRDDAALCVPAHHTFHTSWVSVVELDGVSCLSQQVESTPGLRTVELSTRRAPPLTVPTLGASRF